MILLIMSILLIAYLFAWYGKKRPAIGLFAIDFLIAIYWFYANVTVDIGLSL